MLKILVSLPLVLSCSNYQGIDSHAQHLVERKTEGEGAMIFASRQPNGQHCFYEQSITQQDLQEMRSMQAEAGQERLRQLATSSTLMTPSSLYYKDVDAAMMADSKLSNVATHFVSNYLTVPLSLTCFFSATFFAASNIGAAFAAGPGGLVLMQMVTLGKVAGVSCGADLLLQSGSLLTILANWWGNGKAIRGLFSSRLRDIETANIERLRKIFVWLESRDAMQCPAQFQLPASNASKTKAVQAKLKKIMGDK